MKITISSTPPITSVSIWNKLTAGFRHRFCIAGASFLLVFCSSANAADDDDKLTLGEFTTHITTTFTVITSDALRYATALKRMAEDGVAIIDYFVTYHREGFEQFSGGSGGGCEAVCQEFRTSTIDLLRNQQEILNLIPPTFGAVARIQGLTPPPSLPPADLSPLFEVLEDAPAFILYPLYDAFKQLTGNATGSLEDLNEFHAAAADAMRSVMDVGNGTLVTSASTSVQPIAISLDASPMASSVHGFACQVIADEFNLQMLLIAVPILKFFSAGMNVAGDSIILDGMKMVKKVEGEISLVGEVATNFNVNAAATVGEIFRLIGKISEGMGKAIFSTANQCRLRLNNQVMFCMLTEKNLHANKKFDTHGDCLGRVAAGDENFGFSENWFDQLEQLP